MADLFCKEQGSGRPVVLLHGFGASHVVWHDVVERLCDARRVFAYDLPGHAQSLAVPAGSAAVAAQSVLADLERRGLTRIDMVGHSMGGAAAALAALMEPDRVASLTLLAPGGFGREINHRLLRRYAAAEKEDEIALLLEQFFGWEKPLPPGLVAREAESRRIAGANAALMTIVETFFDGTSQRLVPVGDLAALTMPIKVIWGTQDRVLPTRQAHRLPGRMAVHIYEGVGHMLPQEIPDEVAGLILENSR